jgi:uncharacterized protein YciI
MKLSITPRLEARGAVGRFPGAVALGWALAVVISSAAIAQGQHAAAGDKPTVQGLGQLYYMIVFRPGPNWIKGKPYTQQALLPHGRYLQSLYERQMIVLAGPFMDDAGGFVILDCPSEAEAQAIAAAEPATRSGIFVNEVHPIRYAFDRAAGRSVWPPTPPGDAEHASAE